MSSKEKKKEYNRVYREKQKALKEKLKEEKEEVEKVEKVEIKIEKVEPENEKHVKFEAPPQDEDAETFTIDKTTMNYLLECMKNKQEEEPKKEQPKESPKSESGFFFMMKTALMQQVAMTVPIIALKLIVDGTKSQMPSLIQNFMKEQKQQSANPTTQPSIRVVSLE